MKLSNTITSIWTKENKCAITHTETNSAAFFSLSFIVIENVSKPELFINIFLNVLDFFLVYSIFSKSEVIYMNL